MSFFKKMKTFLGGDAPEILFSYIEESIPVTDTAINYKLAVNAKTDLTVVSVNEILKAVHYDEEGNKKETILREKLDDGTNWLASQNPFPGKLSKDSTWRYANLVLIKRKQSEQLQALFANKAKNKLRLFLELELDIKETGMLFDPSVKREITLLESK